MGKFGWSYPPGCSGTPYDEDYPCSLCLNEVGLCICPECPVCSEAGNETCYGPEGHGMEYTDQQDATYACNWKAYDTPEIWPEEWNYLERVEND